MFGMVGNNQTSLRKLVRISKHRINQIYVGVLGRVVGYPAYLLKYPMVRNGLW